MTTPTSHAAGEAEAVHATREAALLNWYCEHYNPLRIPMADFDVNTLKHYVEKRVAFIAGYSAAAAQSHALPADANAYTVLTDPHALHLHLLRNPLPKATLLHLLGEVYVEALLTRAVEVTLSEACGEVCTWCREGDVPTMVDGDWRHKTISSYMTCRARRIRALDVKKLVAAAMSEADHDAPI